MKCLIDDDGRECSKCGEYRLWSSYSKQPRNATGRSTICNVCTNSRKVELSRLKGVQSKLPEHDEYGRVCTSCRTHKPWDKFGKDMYGFRGKASRCLECKNKAFISWVEANTEAYEDARNKHKVEHGERLKERSREAMRRLRKSLPPGEAARRLRVWRSNNPGKSVVYARKYRQKVGSEALNARNRLARALNPVRYRVYDQRKRVKRKGGFVRFADEKEIEKVYALARRLTRETGVQHHVDHIVPLVHPLVQGLHVHHNLQVVTAEFNLRKGNRFAVA